MTIPLGEKWRKVLRCQDTIGLLLLGIFPVLFSTHIRRYFFLFDDYRIFAVAGAKRIAEIFTEGLIGFYRPVTFLLLKGEFILFGWDAPWGYAFLACLLHTANAFLVSRLAAFLFPSRVATAVLSGCIFVLSPWASEAFLWPSCQFDLLATFLGLSCLLCALRAATETLQKAAFARRMGIVAVLATGSVFAKESWVVLPALFVVLFASRRPISAMLRWRAAIPTLLMGICVALYMGVRSGRLPGLAGAYGDYFHLLRSFRPWGLVHAFLLPPTPSSASMLLSLGRMSFAGLMIFSGVLALRPFRRAGVFVGLALVVSLVPVLPFSVNWNSTSGGRFIYLAGVFVALLSSCGLAEMIRLGTTPRATVSIVKSLCGGIAVGLFLAYAVWSLAYQKLLWGKAADIARSCIEQFADMRHSGSHFFITNLPHGFVQGPYILKSYAFSHYYPASEIQVRAIRTFLSYENGRIKVVESDPDPFSEYAAHPQETVITFEIPGAGAGKW